MSQVLETLRNFFVWQDTSDLERYVSGAANAADVERRIREWETRSRASQFNLP
ncbi:MAG: hypothetical protein KIT73_19110 [Burkholderiales bacterium]|nr:hypothetical protein [Burkholderiales bacterium]